VIELTRLIALIFSSKILIAKEHTLASKGIKTLAYLKAFDGVLAQYYAYIRKLGKNYLLMD
jgi:hypothetical protein